MADGAVEADESPQAACRREVVEELGLDRPSRPDLSAALGAATRSPKGMALASGPPNINELVILSQLG